MIRYSYLVLGVETYPLHGDIKVGEIVETHGDAGGGDRRTDHLQQTLYTAQVDELNRKLLVAQESCKILQQQVIT